MNNVGNFSPCPGCDEIGFSIQVWHEGEQMMQCGNEDCRVQEYSRMPEESV